MAAKAKSATPAEKAMFALIANKSKSYTKRMLAKELGEKFGGFKTIASAWASLKARGVAATVRIPKPTPRYVLKPTKA